MGLGGRDGLEIIQTDDRAPRYPNQLGGDRDRRLGNRAGDLTDEPMQPDQMAEKAFAGIPIRIVGCRG